jgi:hypothetical protein
MGKHSADALLTHNGLQQGDALLSLLFKSASEYTIRKVQVNKDILQLNRTNQSMLKMLVHSVKP